MRPDLLCLAVLAALAAPSPPVALAESGKRPLPGAGRELGIPADGLDRVRLDDGRVVACRLGEPKDGKVTLSFPTFQAVVPKGRIVEVRKFADFDPAPRTEEEKALAAKGLVRFGGRWSPKEVVERSIQAEKDAARKAREEEERHAKWESRWQVDTEHFHFEANIPRDALDYYAGLLEGFYDYFTRAFQITLTQREKRKKLPVYLFRQRDEFRKFHDTDTGGKSEHLLGYFVPAINQERLVFFDLAGNRQETVDVMYHEGTHFIIHLAEPTVLVSRWIHEGCAEYFAAATCDGKKFDFGLVQDGRLLHFQDMIARDRVLPMEHLMKASNPYREGEEPPEFDGECYAQAWTLVHFLMEGKGGKYRAGFVSFLNKHLQRKGKLVAISGSERKYMDFDESRAQLLRCLGLKDFDGLQKELVEYAKALPLRSPAAYAERGEQRWLGQPQDIPGAEADFAAALDRGKDDPEVLARLAFAFQYIPEKGDRVLPLLRRSLELDPLHVRRRHLLASILPPAEAFAELENCIQVDPYFGPALADWAWYVYRDQLQDRDRAGDGEKALVARAIALAEQAVALDPSAWAYHTLASLRLTNGDFEKARDAEKAAAEMEPERMEFLWRLAECHALLGSGEDFARVLRRIELLMRRRAKPEEGATLEEGAAAASQEEIQEEMRNLVWRMTQKCLAWDRKAEACAAMDCWYERRVPKTEQAWYEYADLFRMKGDLRRCGKIALDGLRAFPESTVLKELVAEAAAAQKEGG